MNDFGSALKAIFEKIGEFFDLFDLSFFVSGVLAACGFGQLIYLAGFRYSLDLNGFPKVISTIILFYIAGLICFALGRWFRIGIIEKKKRSEFDRDFICILQAHGLADDPTIKAYIARQESRGIWRLYVRFWAELRENPSVSRSVSLLKRYWVMTATYDGLTVALLVWIIVITFWMFDSGVSIKLPISVGIGGIVILICLVIGCVHEAGRYFTYQLEEVVATIASKQTK